MSDRRRVAVIGGGWAGLAAAVTATEHGHRVTLFETAKQLGGRARSVHVGDAELDNGQHILIGAYQSTLGLMRHVGVSPDDVLHRSPLELVDPHGQGLRLPPGSPLVAFARGVMAHRAWPLRARMALLSTAIGWLVRGFRCNAHLTVEALTAHLPHIVRAELLAPLCVAALNTPADRASASVFLRVLHDALFSGPGCADLLLPRAGLSALLPDAAYRWLEQRGADVRPQQRVMGLTHRGNTWGVDDVPFDAVILACSAKEAARLTATIAPEWSRVAGAFHYEPIVTVYLRSSTARWASLMVALKDGPHAPAQYAFDLGQLGRPAGLFAFVISGASVWVDRGQAACVDAVQQQAMAAFPPGTWSDPPQPVACLVEKRATFACTPALCRPSSAVGPSLWAAGDYVDGPYPATLEGAVRSGIAAADRLAPSD